MQWKDDGNKLWGEEVTFPCLYFSLEGKDGTQESQWDWDLPYIHSSKEIAGKVQNTTKFKQNYTLFYEAKIAHQN